MRKLGGLALLLLLNAGVWVNSLRPAPNVKARNAVGEKIDVQVSGNFKYPRRPAPRTARSRGQSRA